ncbi:MAG: glutaredoxin 3 [Candidatus Competibacterales bacterium]|nr:glutaredoxin 3 [Candidatus Competibacterales bacterium]
MAQVEIYASAFCPFCRWARALLDRKRVDYTLYDVDREPGLRREMQTRSQRHTVPQIFIDGQPIGGYDELSQLDRSGRLDTLLDAS